MLKKVAVSKFAVLLLFVVGFAAIASAQSVTAGDVTGNLTDPTGAAIPGAKVVVTNPATGVTKATTSNGSGYFRVSLLSPGTYTVTVTAENFSTTSNTVMVSAGVVAEDNMKLTIGKSSTTVEITAAPVIVNVENADVVTTFTADQIQALPNPGNDLTFVAQTAPGSVMNTGTTAGGYGNFSSFGVSGLSNMFTLDGGYENDPFLNLNNTGASNLTLGNNEVDTVTIVSPAFSSQFGGLGGAQVNEITTSGGNHVHGNASYYWDGSSLNANDYFNKQAELTSGEKNTPTFVNANQWAASIGGPIIKDRLFWFVNTEGIRAITPANGEIFAPSPLAEACTRGQDPGGTVDVPGGPSTTYATCATLNAAADAAFYADQTDGVPNGNVGVGNQANGILFAPAAPGQLPQMNRVFDTFDKSPYRPATSSPYVYDPATVSYFANSSELLTEWLLTARVDYKISDKDSLYGHYKQDHGTQPTYTDLISPLFTALSLQPAWEGQFNETHIFTPNLTNQLVLTANYYSAPFQNSNPLASVSAAAPSTVEFNNGGFSNSADYYGGENYAFPQGRRVSGYQIIDDVSWTKGRSTYRAGYNFRRDNITDLQGVETIYPVSIAYEESFLSGITDYEYIQRFPQRPTQPVSVYNEGAYVETTFKATPKLSITAGLRFETNSNPTCHTNCYAALANSVGGGSAPVTSPYSAAFTGGLISGNRHKAFTDFQSFALMPRIAFNYQATGKTVLRAGFGMFTDSFPGVVADDLLSNAPTNFHAAVYGPNSGVGANYLGYDITVPEQDNTDLFGTILNPATVASASASAFQTGFSKGATENDVKAAVASAGGRFSTPSITTVAPKIKYPTYEEFSFAIEQSINSKTSLLATYVGNHGYHEPVSDASNNLTNSGAAAGNFQTTPNGKPFASFATVTNIYSGASSNFNGIVLTAKRQSKDLSLQFNYEFSKALDEISNGGFETFAPDAGDSAALIQPGNLHANYGPADYNVKHNITGNFVYQLPTLFRGGSPFVRNLVGGFEFSGDVFHNSGLPYSITQSTTSAGGSPGAGLASTFANGSALLLAQQVNSNFDHHCGGSSHVKNVVTGVVANPCNFNSSFTAPSSFAGGQGRNSLIGPSYTNVDFGAFKTFGMAIPHLEGTKLKVGAQFFNLFNHTNFQNPAHSRSSSNASLGGISGTVGAPTSILGSTGGADASPRLVQLHASLVF